MQLGRYQILKQLATGSIADVLLARASGLEGFARHVVIKRIRPELAREEKFVRAFLDEARIAASLHHQNIVQVHDIGEQDGAYYFAMEYVHGEDVRRLIHRVRERGQQIPLEHAIAIVTATAAGLHYAHEKVNPSTGEPLGIVHRDVSPANVLIGYDGSVKIVDFGLARAAQRSTTTATGTLKGKASYMSPEQCTGRPVDRRSDTFSLGIILFELVTAQRLFKGSNDFMTMAAIVEGAVPRPSTLRPDVSPALDEIMLRALARSPESRYQTAEALRESLEAFTLAQEMRTSAKSLADYLVAQFGERPEPWTAEARLEEPVDVEATYAGGLVPVPRAAKEQLLERHAPKEESPMMLAGAAGEWDLDDEEVSTVVGGVEPLAAAKANAPQTITAPIVPPRAAAGGPAGRAAKRDQDDQPTMNERRPVVPPPPPADPAESSTIVEPPIFDQIAAELAAEADAQKAARARYERDDDDDGLDEDEPATEIQMTTPAAQLPVEKKVIPALRPVRKVGSATRGDQTPAAPMHGDPTVPLPPGYPPTPTGNPPVSQPVTPTGSRPGYPPTPTGNPPAYAGQPPTPGRLPPSGIAATGAPRGDSTPPPLAYAAPPPPGAFSVDSGLTTDPAALARPPTDAVYVGPPAPPLSLGARLRTLSPAQRLVMSIGAGLLVLSVGIVAIQSCGDDSAPSKAPAVEDDAGVDAGDEPAPTDAGTVDAPPAKKPPPKKKPPKRPGGK